MITARQGDRVMMRMVLHRLLLLRKVILMLGGCWNDCVMRWMLVAVLRHQLTCVWRAVSLSP